MVQEGTIKEDPIPGFTSLSAVPVALLVAVTSLPPVVFVFKVRQGTKWLEPQGSRGILVLTWGSNRSNQVQSGPQRYWHKQPPLFLIWSHLRHLRLLV